MKKNIEGTFFTRFLESGFSVFLFRFRHIGLVVAVIFSLISSAFLFIVGAYNGVLAMINFIKTLAVKPVVVGLIKTMDIFLAALVMMLLAVGLYDLYIIDVESRETVECEPGWKRFSTIDELKSSLAKLIVIILIFTFFELVLANLDILKSYELLIVPAGVALIAVSLKLMQ